MKGQNFGVRNVSFLKYVYRIGVRYGSIDEMDERVGVRYGSIERCGSLRVKDDD